MGAEVNYAIIQTSCILSILGSLAVAFTWAFPRSNRQKPGRILLLWLSLTDLLGSVFYFAQTFNFVRSNDVLCKATALLDIFFPVASFLWTDFVALFLFLVVRARLSSAQIDWKNMMFRFHIVVWTTSSLVLLLVLLFNHAGNDSQGSDDDEFSSNTAGWCWVKADTTEELFLWELIGGKLIEWISALIISYLYISVVCTVLSVDRVSTTSQRQPLSSIVGEGPRSSAGISLPGGARNTRVSAASNQSNQSNSNSMPKVSAEYEPDRMYDSDFSGREGSLDKSLVLSEDVGVISRASSVSSGLPGRMSQGSSRPRTQQAERAIFSRFYWKLALLPFAFIAVRFWSSLRIILKFSGSPAANNPFLVIMNAFCDPAQGFVNAALFVLSSPSDRRRLGRFLRFHAQQVVQWVSCGLCGEAQNDVKGGFYLNSAPNSLNNVRRPLLRRYANTANAVHMPAQTPSQLPTSHGSPLDTHFNPFLSPEAPPNSETEVNESTIAHRDRREVKRQYYEYGLGAEDDEFDGESEGIEVEDDFECGDESRLSDFSFDLNSYDR